MFRPEKVEVRAWPLVAATVIFELLTATGVVPSQPGLVHEVALPPLDLTADVALLLGRATTPVWFGIGLFFAVTGRATVLALMMGSLRHWAMALRFELLAVIPAYIGAELCDDGQSVLYSAVFWAGAIVIVLGALVLTHIPWQRPRRLRHALARSVLHGMRGPTVVVYLVALVVLSALVRDGGAAAAVGLVVSLIVSVAFARRLARPGRPAWSARIASLGVVLAAVGISLLDRTSVSVPRPPARAGELVVVSGMDSATGHGGIFTLRPALLGYRCNQVVYYSYVGPGAGARQGQAACPIRSGAPYQRLDTERPLADAVAAFRAEVDRLRPPVTVVAHSSGGFVAWAAVAGDPSTPVRRVVLLGPVEGAHGYPRPGQRGEGTVGASGMRALTELGRSIGFSRFEADLPLARQLLGTAHASNRLYDRRLPRRVRALAVPAASDVILYDASRPFPHAVLACPLEVSHGHLAASTSAAAVVDRFLSGRPQPSCHPWQSWIADLGWGLRVP